MEHLPPQSFLIGQPAGDFLELLVLDQAAHQLTPGIFTRLVTRLGAWFLRKQCSRFDVNQGRGHNQKIAGKREIEFLHDLKILEILPGNQGDRDIVNIDFVLADEVQQKVERTTEGLKLHLIYGFNLFHDTTLLFPSFVRRGEGR